MPPGGRYSTLLARCWAAVLPVAARRREAGALAAIEAMAASAPPTNWATWRSLSQPCCGGSSSIAAADRSDPGRWVGVLLLLLGRRSLCFSSSASTSRVLSACAAALPPAPLRGQARRPHSRLHCRPGAPTRRSGRAARRPPGRRLLLAGRAALRYCAIWRRISRRAVPSSCRSPLGLAAFAQGPFRRGPGFLDFAERRLARLQEAPRARSSRPLSSASCRPWTSSPAPWSSPGDLRPPAFHSGDWPWSQRILQPDDRFLDLGAQQPQHLLRIGCASRSGW